MKKKNSIEEEKKVHETIVEKKISNVIKKYLDKKYNNEYKIYQIIGCKDGFWSPLIDTTDYE